MSGLVRLLYSLSMAVVIIAPPIVGAQEENKIATLCDLAPTGRTTTFSYWRSHTTSDYYFVQAAENTGFPFLVSASFLELALNSQPIDDPMRLHMLEGYPYLMNSMYVNRMQTNYPDVTQSFDTPFDPLTTVNISIVEDPLAPPYVRIRLVNTNGIVEEFSLNRNVVDHLLASQEWDETNLSRALSTYPYRLAEEARVSFSHLTQQQIITMSESVPSVAGQEFVRTRKLYSQSALAAMMTNFAAPPAVRSAPTPLRNSNLHSQGAFDVSSPLKFAKDDLRGPHGKTPTAEHRNPIENSMRTRVIRTSILFLAGAGLVIWFCRWFKRS